MSDAPTRVRLLVAESNLNRSLLCERLDGWNRDVERLSNRVAGFSSLTMICIDLITGAAGRPEASKDGQAWWSILLTKLGSAVIARWSQAKPSNRQ
jgi:hypothetical protein